MKNAIKTAHKFHIQYRWAIILIAICITAVIFFGKEELGKAFWGLGIEHALAHFGRWAASEGPEIAEAVETAEKVA